MKFRKHNSSIAKPRPYKKLRRLIIPYSIERLPIWLIQIPITLNFQAVRSKLEFIRFVSIFSYAFKWHKNWHNNRITVYHNVSYFHYLSYRFLFAKTITQNLRWRLLNLPTSCRINLKVTLFIRELLIQLVMYILWLNGNAFR